MSRPSKHNGDAEKPLSVVNDNIKSDDIFDFITQNDLENRIIETSLYNASNNRNPFDGDIIRCYALAPQDDSFGIRVNTTLAYCATNQKVISKQMFLLFKELITYFLL